MASFKLKTDKNDKKKNKTVMEVTMNCKRPDNQFSII